MKSKLGIAAILAVTGVLVSSSEAHAAGHANGLGEKGQLILSADRLVPFVSYTHSSVTRTEGGVELTNSQSGTNLSLLVGRNLAIEESGATPINVHTIPRAAFDVTVIPQLTLGAAIAFGFGLGGTTKAEGIQGGNKVTVERDAPTATAIGLVPRVGYVIPLTDIFAFWPRVGFGFYSVSSSTEGANNVTTKISDTLFSLDLDPQFAIVPVEHFFILAGPLVNIPLAGSRTVSRSDSSNKENPDTSLFNLGLSLSLGGWFNVF
jgi:hypothetical protein